MKAYCLFLICCIILLSCNSGDGVVEPEKELPPYCTGLKTGVCPESGYPFMSIYKDTVADSCYHVGFYFHIAADDLYLDNRVIYYYGKATIIGDIGHYWFDKKVIYEEEIDFKPFLKDFVFDIYIWITYIHSLFVALYTLKGYKKSIHCRGLTKAKEYIEAIQEAEFVRSRIRHNSCEPCFTI